MMKAILLNSLLFWVLSLSAQDRIDSTLLVQQKKCFEIGEKALNESNGFKALDAYYSVYSLRDLDSKIANKYEIIAKKKIDSLLPLVQKMEAEKWKGKWKLKQLTTENHNYEYIEITDNKVLFYNKNSNTPTRIEKIQFAPYEERDLILPYSSLVFKNNEIWGFTIKEVKNEKRLITEVKREANGDRIFLIDERGMIKDPIMRKKALEKEIRTYYILEK